MEKLKKQNKTIKNGWIIKMDKRWTRGLKYSKKAEMEFVESQPSTVWKQQSIMYCETVYKFLH